MLNLWLSCGGRFLENRVWGWGGRIVRGRRVGTSRSWFSWFRLCSFGRSRRRLCSSHDSRSFYLWSSPFSVSSYVSCIARDLYDPFRFQFRSVYGPSSLSFPRAEAVILRTSCETHGRGMYTVAPSGSRYVACARARSDAQLCALCGEFDLNPPMCSPSDRGRVWCSHGRLRWNASSL
ncbi:hypothetical protein DFP72DRAFT_894609 [Ephemerocybe angulata]|uniref:Uncharacterized protein n=1 Tax=Ephemerocybe angulata TaxID=980116 RepID=A0A8H6I298_9AGAR|nr:hypothetical protein DFP72DRAFT_894609 [Tulosesus angulatus]